jgi:aldehyde dehydrogenase (NAD+)
MEFVERAKQEGARLVSGGERATGGALSSGLFIQPTIFADATNEMTLAREEVFGPVLTIIPFADEDEAIRIANDTSFGLASAIWSRDINRVMRVSKAIRSGMVWVNTYRAVACQTPFGGVKESGFGRERGHEGLMEFVTTKNVMINFSEAERDPFAVQT